ncbi:hypothetical protein BBK82_13075 [Lentzea guizhouensis]|uniref:Uncharacterized protein n=1 Tax=Lentzea guizhouensis TaxID=1586287 RepID=A0A1B2HGM3_9PSEU|nr:hypothetical protein BBK82_13075 [Lentzea guizhouensis]
MVRRGQMAGGLDVLSTCPETAAVAPYRDGALAGYVQFTVRATDGDGGTRMWLWVHASALRPDDGASRRLVTRLAV